MADYSQILDSASEAIGRTPLIALDRITQGMDGRILAMMNSIIPLGRAGTPQEAAGAYRNRTTSAARSSPAAAA
jgi:hypothetical protein